jgi:hypothetical protein
VDLIELARMACGHTKVSDIFDAYCRSLGPVPLPSLLGSLSVLIARRVIVARDRI